MFHSEMWKTSTSPVSKKVKDVLSAGKVMMTIFFDEEKFLYQHSVYQSHTVTAVYY